MSLLIIPPPHFRKQTSLINELANNALLTNLQACLDISDINCYPGTGQTVIDLAGVNNFTLGLSSGSEPTVDPTFVGTAGKETSGEYFRSPDYTYFLTAPANSFANGLHADNAVFSFIGWTRLSQIDLTNGNSFVGNGAPTDLTRISIGSANSAGGFGGKFSIGVTNAGVGVMALNSGISVSAGSIFFYGISFDEAAGTWAAQINGTQASGSGASYVSPAASGGIACGLRVMSNGDPAGGYSGDTFASAAWSRKLTAAEIDGIFQATRNKYGV